MAKKKVAKKKMAKNANKKAAKTAKKSITKKTAAKKSAPKAKSKVKPKTKPKAKPTAKKATASKMKPAAVKTPTKKKSASENWQDFFVPLDDRVLARVLGKSDRTSGGLYIPDTAQERPNTAEILSVGPGHRDEKGRRHLMDVKVGEKILLTEYTGRTVELRGETLLLVRESDIIGTVE